MYNGPAQNYNSYRNRRVRRRKNVTVTSYTNTGPDGFSSITAARAFLLQHENDCNLPDENSPEYRKIMKQVRNAKKIIRKADRRNLRRRITAATKKLAKYKNVSARRNPDTAGCKACGQEFENFVADKSCPTCGREIKSPAQEREEALESLYQAMLQGIENAEISLRDLKNSVLRYAKKAANDDVDVIEEVMDIFARAVSDSGEHKSLPHGPLREFVSETLADEEFSEEEETGSLFKQYSDASKHNWERVFGPHGEILVFKVEHQSRRDIKVTPTKTPRFKDADVILDLTKGVIAFQVRQGQEVQIPVSKYMREHYEGSFLFKVRKLAAGWKPSSFASSIKNMLRGSKKPAFSRSKKLKKRKK